MLFSCYFNMPAEKLPDRSDRFGTSDASKCKPCGMRTFGASRGSPRGFCVILTVTAEKLPYCSYSLGEPDALDADAGREGAEQAAGQARVQHHEHAAVVGAADQAAVGLLQPQPGQ